MHRQLEISEKDSLTVCNQENSTIVLIFSVEITGILSFTVSSRGSTQKFSDFPSNSYSVATTDENIEINFLKQSSLFVDIWIVPSTSCLYHSYIVSNKKDINLIVNMRQGQLDACLFTPSTKSGNAKESNQKNKEKAIIEYGFINGEGTISVYNGTNTKDPIKCTIECNLEEFSDIFIHFKSPQTKGFYYSREKSLEELFRYCTMSRPIILKSKTDKIGKSDKLIGEDLRFKCYRSFTSWDSFYDSSLFAIIAQLLFFVVFPITGALSIILILCCPKKKNVQKQTLDTSLYPDDDDNDGSQFGLLDEDVTFVNEDM